MVFQCLTSLISIVGVWLYQNGSITNKVKVGGKKNNVKVDVRNKSSKRTKNNNVEVSDEENRVEVNTNNQ